MIDGDNRPGLGHAIAAALGAAGLNGHFLVTLVMGKRYRSVVGFGEEASLAEATRVIRSAAAPPRRAPARRPAAKRAGRRATSR
jgi:hypothetical protein